VVRIGIIILNFQRPRQSNNNSERTGELLTEKEMTTVETMCHN